MSEDDFQPLSYWLLLAMQVMPVFFVWIFLRRVYRPSLRRAAFVYAGVTTILPMIGTL